MKQGRHSILFVDDEEAQRRLVAGYFENLGHPVVEADSGESALKVFASSPTPVMCVDLKMPGMSGIQLVGKILEIEPATQIIVLTAFGTVETAVAAMKAGAFHYQTKPVDLEELTVNIAKALAQYELLREATRTRQALRDTAPSEEIIGESGHIESVRELISLVGPSESSVLISGPSGSGKELVARALHQASPRHEGRFVAVNCGAFPEALLESELFGHEKGAFTGAAKRKIGRFELADNGTLFLDEIGEAPLALQVKLLRALETRRIERLGSEVSLPVDFRLIAATNRELTKEIEVGSFREDLFYRLNVVSFKLEPLSERPEDIPLLAQGFLDRYAQKSGRQLEFSQEALSLMRGYVWPGNVRELQNMVERAVTLAREDTLGPELFTGLGTERMATTPEKLSEVERQHIERVLKKHNWSIQLTAEKLGIHRNTLAQKVKEYGLKKN